MIMLLHERLTHIHSQKKKPRLHFGESFTLRHITGICYNTARTERNRNNLRAARLQYYHKVTGDTRIPTTHKLYQLATTQENVIWSDGWTLHWHHKFKKYKPTSIKYVFTAVKRHAEHNAPSDHLSASLGGIHPVDEDLILPAEGC